MDTNVERRERPHGLVVPDDPLEAGAVVRLGHGPLVIGSDASATCAGHSLVQAHQGADVHSTTASCTTMTWVMTQQWGFW